MMRINEMDQFRVREKLDAVAAAEKSGEVADSMDIRLRLVRQVEAGEMTLDECQAELKRIKRNASKNGKTTRAKVYRQS